VTAAHNALSLLSLVDYVNMNIRGAHPDVWTPVRMTKAIDVTLHFHLAGSKTSDREAMRALDINAARDMGSWRRSAIERRSPNENKLRLDQQTLRRVKGTHKEEQAARIVEIRVDIRVSVCAWAWIHAAAEYGRAMKPRDSTAEKKLQAKICRIN
jgi:hypothetical protein